MNEQLFVDSLVAVNIVVSSFLLCFISLWIWRSDQLALHKRQAFLLIANLFPAMMIISLSHASWSIAPDFLSWSERIFTLVGGALFFDFIYGRINSRTCVTQALVLVGSISALLLFSGNTHLILLIPAAFTMAAFALYWQNRATARDRILAHALSVAMTIHLAQLLRFLGRDLAWFEELVPFTATLLGLSYMIWLFLPQQRTSRKSQDEEGVIAPVFDLVDRHLKTSRCYRDSRLNLASLARELDLPSYIVSQAINQYAGRFNDYVNQFRIEDFLDQYREQQNIEALAHQVGFNSRSAFYRAFRSATGKTPSQYIYS